MADKSHYNKKMKVKQSVIDEIKELGMGEAIKKANSGNASRAFVEGVRRFYPDAIDDIEEKKEERTKESLAKTERTREERHKKSSSSSSSNSSSRSNSRSGIPDNSGAPGPTVEAAAVQRRLNGESSSDNNSRRSGGGSSSRGRNARASGSPASERRSADSSSRSSSKPTGINKNPETGAYRIGDGDFSVDDAKKALSGAGRGIANANKATGEKAREIMKAFSNAYR